MECDDIDGVCGYSRSASNRGVELKRVHRKVLLLVGWFIGVCARVGFGQFADTAWTGSAGNGLWGDAGNWSNGVPTRDRSAEMKKTTTIDLGGVTREAKWVYMTASPSIRNGTLATTSIRGAYFTIPASTTINRA